MAGPLRFCDFQNSLIGECNRAQRVNARADKPLHEGKAANFIDRPGRKLDFSPATATAGGAGAQSPGREDAGRHEQ